MSTEFEPTDSRERPEDIAGGIGPKDPKAPAQNAAYQVGSDSQGEIQVNARLSEIAEVAPDAFIVIDLRGNMTFANRQTEAMFGYRRDELLGEPVEKLIPTGLRLAHRTKRKQNVADSKLRPMGKGIHLFGRRADGSQFPVEVNLGPVMLSGSPHIIATCRDVTDRSQLEQTLRLKVQELERTFEAMSEGVYVYDAAGALVKMNAAAREVSGFETRQEPTQSPPDECPPSYQPRDSHGEPLSRDSWPVMRVLRGETISNDNPMELQVIRPDGQSLVHNVTGAPLRDTNSRIVGAVIVYRDVTRQRRLEQELEARANEIESIFQTDADGVRLFDSQGRTLRMNAAMRRLLGVDATSEIEGIATEEPDSGRIFQDPEGATLPREEWPIYRILRGERLTGDRVANVRLRTLDGRDILVTASGAPLVNSEGQIIGGVISMRDITVQNQREQERSDILRVVTHDLANPVAAIKTYLQLQQRRLERGRPSPPDPQILTTLTQDVVRMQRLLDDLRVVVGLEAKELSLEVRTCDLAACCRQEVKALQMASARTLQVNIPDYPVPVKADPDRIGQVLANLLSNADKYSPPQLPVALQLDLFPGEPSHGIARVRIQDHGPGIALDEQPRLWNRFHRVANVQARPGTGGSLGLGLFISRKIIERHGGEIGVESAPGKGSTFWFTLSLAEEQTAV